ncbi:MAG: DUF2752 domain-containing protein [Bacteroidetes bacterium]|jgi:hypothetical protein|nr:DUF2752 domain-containing protein [Bacteroidota bacterium]
MIHRLTRLLRALSPEAFLWAAALVVLAATDPTAPPLLRLCPLDLAGVAFCPGCGLGRAAAHFLQGAWAASWALHPLAGPTVVILCARIGQLIHEAVRASTLPTA